MPQDESDAPQKKPLAFVGPSRKELSGFPADVREDTGRAITRIQYGEDPPNTHPMSGIGSGTRVITIDHDTDTYRTAYVAVFPEAVYVLHAFQKKSKRGRQTPKQNRELAVQRYKDLVQHRTEQGYL